MPRLYLVADFIEHVTELDAHMAAVAAWSALLF